MTHGPGIPGRRDRRVGYGEGWVLLAGMAVAGAAIVGMFWMSPPRAWWRIAALFAAVLFARFVLAPLAARFTRALRSRPARRRS